MTSRTIRAAGCAALFVLLSPCGMAQTEARTQPAQRPAAKAARTAFHVKYVAHNAVYIDGGTADDLAEGMVVELSRRPPGSPLVDTKPVGTAIIRAVAMHSAVCDLQSTTLTPQPGDEAKLTNDDEVLRARNEIAKGNRKYLQVIEFSGGSDPLDEEMRAYVPRPEVKETTRMRGSIAFEQMQILDHASGANSSQTGAAIRVDWKNIEGSYWTLTGYWRGDLTTSATSPTTTLLDVMNRTYQIGLYYANPQSNWGLGVGRLFVPGATSLGVVDGAYVTRKINRTVSAAVFAGTDPDPTQWNYAPNRQTAGALLRFETGSFENAHWNGSFGLALTRVNWHPERQYVFAENTFTLGKVFSLFQTLQADQRNPLLMNGATGAQLSQSFTTARLQISKRVAFDLNHNYLRAVPTFDQRLLGSGLLDQYLFTGFSGGLRLEPISQLLLVGTWGESRKNGDTRQSVNQYYSAGWKKLPWIDARIDARYSNFSSSFGTGSYRSLALSRDVVDNLRLQFEAGIEDVRSALASQGRTHYFNTMADWQFSRHYFFNGGWLYYRGQSQNYDQIYFSLGYRFR